MNANEPVAWKVWNRMGGITFQLRKPDDSEYVEYEPLYTHPVKELTDEEIIATVKDHFIGAIKVGIVLTNDNVLEFARAILRKAQATCNGFCGDYECKENQGICKRKAQEK